MIDNMKHTMHLGNGDVDISVLESPSGTPVIAFTNRGDPISPSSSFFLGFSSGDSIDSMISFLRNLRRTYYPQRKSALSNTQRFSVFTDKGRDF